MTATSTETISSDRPLLGRRALVTGATAGIGAAIATALGRDGAEVLVLGRDAERGAGIVKSVHDAGGQAAFVQADLARIHRFVRVGSVEAADWAGPGGVGLFGRGAWPVRGEERFRGSVSWGDLVQRGTPGLRAGRWSAVFSGTPVVIRRRGAL